MRRRLLFLLLAAAIVILYTWRLGGRSFWEPDEPRYAEIGREMLDSGDWVIPRLNFIKYYEKPPLTYWSVAASFAAFGESEGTARLGPVIAGLFLILATWTTARALYDARTAALGAVMLALSPLAWVTGRLLVTDMLLSSGIAWAVAGVALALRARETGRTPDGAMAVAGLGFAAAVLAKGPVGILIPLFGIIPLRILAGRAAALGFRAWAVTAGVTLAVAAPWFVLISVRDPAFAWFFFIHEHVLRYATPVAHREGASYYYLVIILAGLFPGSILLPWAARRVWPRLRPRTLADRGTVLLGTLAIVTFLFFSASQSKLPGYILPCAPALALIIARALALALGGARGAEARIDRGASRPGLAQVPGEEADGGEGSRLVHSDSAITGGRGVAPSSMRSPSDVASSREVDLLSMRSSSDVASSGEVGVAPLGLRASFGVAALAALGGGVILAVFAARGALSMVPDHNLIVLGGLAASLSIVLGWAALSRRTARIGTLLSVAAAVLAFLLINLNSIAEAVDPLQSVKEAAGFVAKKAGPDDIVASYGTILQGLTFYCGRRTTIVGGPGELAFGVDQEPPGAWLVARNALPALLDLHHAYIVVPAKSEGDALRDGRGRLRRIFDGPKFKVLSNE